LIDALHYKKFDLLILEWHFPDMDGHAIIKAIRRGESKNMMVMFLTHQISDADVAMGLKAGANDYATKPIAASDLIVRIHALSKIASHSIFEKDNPVKRMPDLLGVVFIILTWYLELLPYAAKQSICSPRNLISRCCFFSTPES
jgi:DNA-binding response OmpR family regulator